MCIRKSIIIIEFFFLNPCKCGLSTGIFKSRTVSQNLTFQPNISTKNWVRVTFHPKIYIERLLNQNHNWKTFQSKITFEWHLHWKLSSSDIWIKTRVQVILLSRKSSSSDISTENRVQMTFQSKIEFEWHFNQKWSFNDIWTKNYDWL